MLVISLLSYVLVTYTLSLPRYCNLIVHNQLRTDSSLESLERSLFCTHGAHLERKEFFWTVMD